MELRILGIAIALFFSGLLLISLNTDALGKGASLILKSTAFSEGETIPRQYTCEGQDVSPPLQWESVPENARSLVLIVDDPDAPDPRAPKTIWVHWVLYNIPPDVPGRAQGVPSSELPPGTQEGLNDWKRKGYGGPCPPIGEHRYMHKLYALDTVLGGLDKPTKAQVEKAMKGHVIQKAILIGVYEKGR
jgi:hypothetical protein